jgi:hypothetical protein
LYDTAGLIPADPQRPSLPIAETKEEAKKSSAAWTKEGKRDREMSYLILPRPEKVTMPAAILPKPDKKHGKKKSWEAPLSDKPSEPAKIEGSAAAPEPPAPVTAETSSAVVQTQATSGLNAGQLLLQLVTMLRQDDSALSSLKAIVDGMSVSTAPPPAPIQENKSEAIPSPQEPAQAIQPAEAAPAHSDKEVKPEIPAPIELQIPHPVVEATIPSPPILAVDAKPPTPVEPVITPDKQEEVPDTTPPVEEIMIFPKKKSKSHKQKHHDKSEKHKSKSKHSHKKSSAATAAEKPVAAPVAASGDEDLVREELWYHVDDPTDGGDESEIPRGELKGKAVAPADVNQRPHVVGKLYEPPSLHATKKSSKSTPPAEPKTDRKSDLTPKPVATEAPAEKPATTPSAPFEFNPAPPRRVKRRVVLISNDASTQTPTPPRTPPTGPVPEIIHHPSPERPPPATPTPASKPAIAKPAVVHPAVIVSAPVRSVVKPSAAPPSPPRPRIQHSGKKLGTPVAKAFVPLSVPDSYTGSDEVYMKTLMNVDAGDDLMIVSNPKEEEGAVRQVLPVESHVVQSPAFPAVVTHVVPAHSHVPQCPAVQSDVAAEPVVAPKKLTPDLTTPPTQDPSAKDVAAEALAAIKDDPAALYNLLTALTTQPASAEKPPKKEKKDKEKKRKDKDGERKKHRKTKVVVEEELLGDLLGDEGSVASLPVLNPSP